MTARNLEEELESQREELHQSYSTLLDLTEQLFDDEDDKDITFELADGTLRAHSLVLKKVSEVWARMFATGMAESSSRRIKIPDTTCTSMRVFLRMLYTTRVNKSDWQKDGKGKGDDKSKGKDKELQAYLVDNSALNDPSGARGLAFRKSKDVHDRDEDRVAEWNTIVIGEEDGGWVKVGDRFLPLRVAGAAVLKVLEPEEATRLRGQQEIDFTITRDHGGLAGYQIPKAGHLAVLVVDPDGPAYRAGMREGHVGWIITHVDGLQVTAETGRAALDATRWPDWTFTIRVKRPVKELDILPLDLLLSVTTLAKKYMTRNVYSMLVQAVKGRMQSSVTSADREEFKVIASHAIAAGVGPLRMHALKIAETDKKVRKLFESEELPPEVQFEFEGLWPPKRRRLSSSLVS